MILKYVLKNFRRRKMRTILMTLSLIVSTGLIVAMSATVETIRQSSVDLIASFTGRYDLTVRPVETNPDPFIAVAETSQRILDAHEQITAVYPRFLSAVELRVSGEPETHTMLALDPAENVGQIAVISGTYQLGNMQAALLQGTETSLGAEIGDTIEIAYSFPQPREEGSVASVGSSQRRAVGQFTINAIVRQNGIANNEISGVMVHIDDAQAFLGLPDRAEELIVLVEPALYEAGNAEAVLLGVRDVAVTMQTALGDQYDYRLDKAQALEGAEQAFLFLQALINTYGLMSLAVVGLLIYTLIMTNVQEQRREMAILRILGSQQKLLFGIVVTEVFVIGIVGVGIGILFGQAITTYLVVPFIESQVSQDELTTTIQPAVSLTAMLPAIISAFVVLVISAIKPAQDASKTKVLHAINPGVADNIQLEDLDQLRERRPNMRLFYIGLGLMFVVLMLFSLILADTLGNPLIVASILLANLVLMVVGLVFVFFIFTRPLEKLILFLIGLISPRLTYFARRNVGRSTERNTLISLLVLFSGVLPSFLATQSAMDFANIETNVRLEMGAPVDIQTLTFSRLEGPEFDELSRLRPSFVSQELQTVPGIENAVGLTHEYRTQVSDVVGTRTGELTLVGVSGDLNEVLYEDMMIFTAGGPDALAQLLTDPTAVVISQGMADGLGVPLGGAIKVQGEGLDHEEALTVVGIAQRLPGFEKVGRVRNRATNGGTVFISLDGFRRVITDPREALPYEDDPILKRVLATLSAGSDPEMVDAALHKTFNREYDLWTRLMEVELQRAREEQRFVQVLLLVMTLLSFITAVFGVFAVIYVTIYARRQEIGMMKAIGVRNWELNGMLSVESITMTLSAALAGILAGSMMAYALSYVNNVSAQRPQQFTIDTTVMPFIIILVVVASILATMFSARRIIKHKAVKILRMS